MALWPLTRREVPSQLLRHCLGPAGSSFTAGTRLGPQTVRSISGLSCPCYRRVSHQSVTGRRDHVLLTNNLWRRTRLPTPLLSQGCANVSNNPNLPPLMEGAPIVWPSVINGIRNWFFTNFVIRPSMDREFSMEEFGKGAREALSIISTKLSKGEYDDLEDLIEPAAFSEIKRNLAKFNVVQREMLSVDVDDIYFQFPHEIGIILPERAQQSQYAEGVAPPQVRQVEITMVFHVMKGIASEMSSPEFTIKSPKDFLNPEDTHGRLMVCNYRFFRDFTEGQDPSWIVNMVNHFLPTEQAHFSLMQKYCTLVDLPRCSGIPYFKLKIVFSGERSRLKICSTITYRLIVSSKKFCGVLEKEEVKGHLKHLHFLNLYRIYEDEIETKYDFNLSARLLWKRGRSSNRLNLGYKSGRTSGPMQSKLLANHSEKFGNFSIHLALAEVQGFVEKYQVEQLAPFPGTVQNIFLLTTCRSGSSFFGEAIASHPAIFYHYEPLLYFSFERIRRPGQNLERAFQTLGNLSKCDYSRAPKYMQSLKTYRNMLVLNSKISSPCTKLSYNCFDLDFLKKSCSLFPVQVFKLTRLRGKTAGELLKRFRGSKLIYLVRDPRAIYSSRLETGWCKLNSSFCDIRRLCADLEEDLVEMTAFATENNKNVLLVKYEDMIMNTRQNFERVYTFIGLKWHNNLLLEDICLGTGPPLTPCLAKLTLEMSF
ncbi:unnamed protein product [Allacma fusca]|uniref:Sulfotransferase n=1 Tax=Allacma fusca TaxID=39272 RepID=A0A8J2KHV3_9HEXA|nr:unnamed protein product [Allacma fusca]